MGLASYSQVTCKSCASCPRVTCELLSSHMQTTRVIINCTTIGLLYLYCYKPFVISITKEYYSVLYSRCQLIPVHPSDSDRLELNLIGNRRIYRLINQIMPGSSKANEPLPIDTSTRKLLMWRALITWCLSKFIKLALVFYTIITHVKSIVKICL